MPHLKILCLQRRSSYAMALIVAITLTLGLNACGSSVAPLLDGDGTSNTVQPADGANIDDKHCAPLPGTTTLAKACEQAPGATRS